jgi:hypothetical protein
MKNLPILFENEICLAPDFVVVIAAAKDSSMRQRHVNHGRSPLVNTSVETFPDVSQFWTYDPKQFLAAPTYSRDIPPAAYLE